ncbi:MAG TPA: hypothetical protein VLU96_04280 [Gaiellaceae bacterium]|nr:hypothetical protein [Gaiellaceae bacterium]
MRRLKWLAALAAAVGALVVAAPALAAPPSNDNFAGAIALNGSSGSVSGTTVGATNEPNEPSGGSLGVWYSWKPSVSGATVFDTCAAANFDTWVDVFTGPSLSSLSLVASGDDGCGVKQSIAPFRANAGTKYWIRVGGYNGYQGTFTLSWNVQTNDDLATAQVLSGRSGSVNGSTLGATDEPGEPATSGGGLWYSWTALGTGTVTFDTCSGAQFDTVIDAFAGTSIATLSQVARNDDACGPAAPGDHGRQSSVTFSTTAGTTYSIRVSGSPGTSPNAGSFTLAWSYTGPESVPVTGTSLCLLTAQDVQSSVRYQSLGLTAAQQLQVNAVVGAQCQALDAFLGRLTPLQKKLAAAVYKLTVTSLYAGNWLTLDQRTTLFALSDQL